MHQEMIEEFYEYLEKNIDFEPYVLAGYLQRHHLPLLQKLLRKNNGLFSPYFDTARKVLRLAKKFDINMKNRNLYGVMGGNKRLKREITLSFNKNEVDGRTNIMLTDRFMLGIISHDVLFNDAINYTDKEIFISGVKRNDIKWFTPIYKNDALEFVKPSLLFLKLKYPEIFAQHENL